MDVNVEIANNDAISECDSREEYYFKDGYLYIDSYKGVSKPLKVLYSVQEYRDVILRSAIDHKE